VHAAAVVLTGVLHVTAAVVALLLGAAVLGRPQGHRAATRGSAAGTSA
jgi:hypothetical protein